MSLWGTFQIQTVTLGLFCWEFSNQVRDLSRKEEEAHGPLRPMPMRRRSCAGPRAWSLDTLLARPCHLAHGLCFSVYLYHGALLSAPLSLCPSNSVFAVVLGMEPGSPTVSPALHSTPGCSPHPVGFNATLSLAHSPLHLWATLSCVVGLLLRVCVYTPTYLSILVEGLAVVLSLGPL